MRGVAGDEHAARAVAVGDREAQVPETDVLELDIELDTGRFVDQAPEVEVVPGRPGRHRRVKEPRRAEIDPAEEFPVALQVGMQNAEERLAGMPPLQQPVQSLRAEHQQHHQPVMVRQGLRYARLLAHDGAAAVATHQIVGPQAPLAAARALGDAHADAIIVLAHLRCAPPIQRLDARQLADAPAQDGFRRILWQPLVVREVERAHQLPLHPVVAVGAEQRPIGGEPADAVLARNGPRRAHLLLHPPEVEVLHGALGKVLAARDRRGLEQALHQHRAHAALPQLDRQPEADRPTADDDDLRIVRAGLLVFSCGHRQIMAKIFVT